MKKSTSNSPLIWLTIGIPFVAFVAMLFTYAVNVPWMDDIDVYPDFLGKFVAATSTNQQLWLLFKPNNEHRVVYAKLMNLAHYYVTGTLNMRTLTILSNSTLLGILWILWRVVKEQKLAPIYFLPIPFLLLQPQYYLTSLWTITGFQYQPVVFFGLLGMYLLTKSSKIALGAAILAVIFDSFTMSNGMFYWVAGLIILWLQGSYKRSAIWGVFMVITINVYFLNFDNGANQQGFTYFAQHPHESFLGFFTHLGGSFDFFNTLDIVKRAILPTITGFLLVGIIAYWLVSMVLFSTQKPFVWLSLPHHTTLGKLQDRLKESQSNYVILGGTIFLLINALVIAILRPRFGFDVMIVGNYKIYPAMFLVMTYLVIITSWQRVQTNTLFLYGFITASILFNGLSYAKFLPEVHERRKDLLVRMYNQQYNKIGLGPQIHSPFYDYVNTAMDNVVAKGIYHYPEGFYSDMSNQLHERLENQPRIVATVRKTDAGMLIQNETLSNSRGLNDGNYILLKSSKHTYLWYEKHPNYFRVPTGCSVLLPNKTFEPDTYQIGIVHVEGTKKEIYTTHQTVTIVE